MKWMYLSGLKPNYRCIVLSIPVAQKNLITDRERGYTFTMPGEAIGRVSFNWQAKGSKENIRFS
jgi:hypothetical protein